MQKSETDHIEIKIPDRLLLSPESIIFDRQRKREKAIKPGCNDVNGIFRVSENT